MSSLKIGQKNLSAPTSVRSRYGLDRVLRPVPAGVALAYAGILLVMFLQHWWILDQAGKPATLDYLAIWTTGRLAIAGRSESLYDPNIIHQAQIAAAGHAFPGYFYWNYPPTFILVAMALAVLPYALSFLSWVFVTGVAFAATLKAILGRWEAALAVCASPAILLNVYLGQTGFLTAALMGGFLILLPARPILGGIMLGLMTYKPQFGILIPFALIAGGYWRAIGSAALTTAAIMAVAELAFGTATFAGFLHSLPVASRAYLTLGEEGWTKMQSVYSVARFMGAGDQGGWIAQGLAVLLCAAAMVALWKFRVDYALKAAGLVTTSMLSTPYVHVYDFPVLLIAMAFLYRHRPFDRVEWIAVVSANIAMGLFPAQLAPVGTGIVMLVAGLILRRAICSSLSTVAQTNAALLHTQPVT